MSDAPATFERVSNGLSSEPAQAYRIEVPGGWIYLLTPQYREPCAVFVPKPIEDAK